MSMRIYVCIFGRNKRVGKGCREMTQSELSRILNKKRWTGVDLGQLQIATLVKNARFKQGIGNGDKLFDNNRFYAEYDNLAKQSDITAYKIYTIITNNMVDYNVKAQIMIHQFYHGFYSYLSYIEKVKHAEEAEILKNARHPVIMTQSQYDRLKAEAQVEKQANLISFRAIVFDTLQHYIRQIEARSEASNSAENAITEAIKATKSEPVTNKRIQESYNADTESGYYALPDGRRSDEMSGNEWLEVLKQEGLECFYASSSSKTLIWWGVEEANLVYKLLFKGEDAIKKAAKEANTTLSKGITDDEVIGLLEEVIDGKNYNENPLYGLLEKGAARPIWYYYNNPPASLSKYDVIASEAIKRYNGNGAHFTEFTADYPALFKALKEEIESRVERAKKLKPAQYGSPLFTQRELALADLRPYNMLDVTDADIIREYCKTRKGENVAEMLGQNIAIASNTGKHIIDSQGDYVDMFDFEEMSNIDDITKNQNALTVIKEKLRLLKSGAQYILGFHAIIDVIKDVYDIEGLEYVKIDTGSFNKSLDRLNSTLYSLYSFVFGSETETKRKRALIREAFIPVFMEDIEPLQKDIDELHKTVSKAGLKTEAIEILTDFFPLILKFVRF